MRETGSGGILAPMHTFQKLLTTLTNFWADKGCIIHQGHDVEVGAGTFNPATFFRCLGPEPYSTVYIEPSRRPQDGRYGENPNRLQLFHQMQVIIKPSPLNIQKLYLESLEAIGFDLTKHDVRFVHDDWESPTLGAWGLGWEVWIDGMEITQFTYFQSVASMPLKPITVELTYGLERLSMILQKKESLFDMQWNDTYTYGEIVKQNEFEWSRYNFEESTPEMWFRHFEDYEKEVKQLVKKGLPFPAYDFVMKASHSFNMLEARGMLSTTERNGYIARVRELARLAAEAFVAEREKAGFPLMRHIEPSKLAVLSGTDATSFDPANRQDYVLEIGSEELPAGYIPRAAKELQRLFEALLKKHDIPYESIETTGAPRRLVAYVQGLAEGTNPVTEERKGPPLSVAFDGNNCTKQGEGFFKSIHLSPISLDEIRKGAVHGVSVREIKGNEYLFAHIEKPGVSTASVFAEELPKVVTSIPFPKRMRWADLEIEYARPLQWIVSLHGETVLPFAIGTLIAGNKTRGHAQRAPKEVVIPQATMFFDVLKSCMVLASDSDRKAKILEQLDAIEEKHGVVVLEKEKVIAQVLYLAEWPECQIAEFDPAFLAAPPEVLTSEMVEHQKYFPLEKADGTLTHSFIITADNIPSQEIAKGNCNVLSARLSDGVFLCNQDMKQSLDFFANKLKNVIFQKELGTVYDKVVRISHLAKHLQTVLSISNPEEVARAAALCKADLATELVGEFPDLQGMVGRHYALSQGENHEVAYGIEEHWMPRSEKGTLPKTETGIILSLADKLDNLCAYFSVGLKPTSSSDPYALRRQTLGLLRILIEHKLSLSIPEAIEIGLVTLSGGAKDEILTFITQRAKTVYEEYGLKKDEIEATLSECTDPYDQYLRVQALHEFRGTDTFSSLYEVYKRARGQLSKQGSYSFAAGLLKEDAEHGLYQTIQSIDPEYSTALKGANYPLAYTQLAALQKPLATLFDQVKILDDDSSVRENRIALLQEVFSRFDQLLDFSKIQE